MNKFSRAKSRLKMHNGRAKLSFLKQNSILLLSIVVVLFFTGYPMLTIVKNSIFSGGIFSTAGYANVFSSAATYKALLNTLIVAFGVLLFAGIIGGGLALLAEKTDFKYKKLLHFSVFLQFCIPSYILSVSWIQITSRGGYLNRLFRLFDPSFSYDFSPYSLAAVIAVLSIHLYPLVFFGISNALRKSGGVLEDAGRISGASPFKVLRSISLPLVMPSFLSTGLLVFSRTMANFGVAAQLALPVRSEVLTTRIYKAISELDIQSLSVLSLLLIAISYAFYHFTERWIKSHAFYGNGSGHTSNRELMVLGKRAGFVYPAVMVFFFVVLVFPLVTLVLSSFMKRWGLAVDFGNMTLNNYKLVLFQNDLMRRAFSNSLFYGTLSACISTSLAIVIVYFYRHVQSKSSQLLMSVSSLPLSVPNIILGVGAVFAWINPPLKLYGTKWIIILTYTILFTPIIVKQIKGLSENIEPAADFSARTLGIPVSRRILHLFLPRVFSGAVSGWIISFLIALREIPISLLLYSKGNETVGVLLFTIQSNSYGLETTSTIAVLVIIISIIGNILVNKLCEKRFINGNIATE